MHCCVLVSPLVMSKLKHKMKMRQEHFLSHIVNFVNYLAQSKN
jgi:hypothetical protein